MKFLFYAFLLYLAWKLVFNLVIPVYRTTKKVKRGFREMQQKMEEAQRQQQQQSRPNPQPIPEKRPIEGDYIEFEDVK
ncbi:MAG: hypothetical protein ACXWC7_08080 [Chitinophagaceae bacterium]